MPKTDSNTFTIHAAKTHLSQLIARVEAGEEVIIARGEKPVARLSPIETPKPKREFGKWSDRIGKVAPEFFDALRGDELEAWEGKFSDDHGVSRPEKK